jgi:hypothetical protein
VSLEAAYVEEAAMPAPWKVALIGGEVTVLVAFTGIGLHIAIQPHRPGLTPPPPVMLPVSSGRPLPTIGTPVLAPPPAVRPSATPKPPSLGVAWLKGLGREDRNLLTSQWDVLQGLMGAIERYLRDKVVPEMERNR